jgi:nucleoside-diphosphate-sugar epimerase
MIQQRMNANSAPVLVTGGTGFLGRVLVKSLVAAGLPVRILTRREYPAHRGVEVRRGDVTQRESLREAIRGCEVVFHCAGEKTEKKRMVEVNVTATKSLVELARDMRIRHLCHLSSVGVIGKTRLSLVDESAGCDPMNLYESTKLEAEKIVGEGLDGGRVAILRPTNIFDSGTLDDMVRTPSRLRNFIKGGEHSHFVYVHDVVAAAIYLMYAPTEKPVDTFILSSDEEGGHTFREIQALLASRVPDALRAAKISAPIFVPYLARLLRHGRTNYGDIVYSSRKIRGLGFSFPFGLKGGLTDAINRLLEGRTGRRADQDAVA